MSSRYERRRFRHEASRSLQTFLCAPDDPALNKAPLLKAAANHWLNALTHRVRHCIVCNSWIVDRRDVAGLLLTVPCVAKPVSVGTAAICRACWDADLPVDALERACARVLRSVIPDGRFQDAR
ncbi:MAG: hypothetical protein ACXWC3_29445 [Burkholderiales bacterium]